MYSVWEEAPYKQWHSGLRVIFSYAWSASSSVGFHVFRQVEGQQCQGRTSYSQAGPHRVPGQCVYLTGYVSWNKSVSLSIVYCLTREVIGVLPKWQQLLWNSKQCSTRNFGKCEVQSISRLPGLDTQEAGLMESNRKSLEHQELGDKNCRITQQSPVSEAQLGQASREIHG